MGLYKRGERFWWGSYYDARTKEFVRRSTKCTDKEAARAVLRGWERAAADPEYRPKDSAPLRAVIATYREAKRRAKRKPGTLSMIFGHVRHIARILGDDTLARAITAKMVDGYVAQRQDEGAANSTIAKELGTLRGMLKLAHRHELCDHPDKVMPLDFDGESQTIDRRVETPSDLAKLVDAFKSERRRAHILYLAATGCDLGPSFTARRDSIDFERGTVIVPGTKTKQRAREVPIVDINRALLERVCEVVPKTGPMFAKWGSIRRDLAVACKRAGIPRVTPRDFRRTLGTWLRERGIEPAMIGSVLGHRDGRMAERVYGKLSPEALRQQLAERLERDAVVRNASAPAGLTGRMTLDQARENALCAVPGDRIELSTRGFSSGGKSRVSRGVSRRDRAVQLENGTRLYGGPVRTFGQLLDDALALGAS